jgi:peptidyl-prolyl cis-trans isomerase SurA
MALPRAALVAAALMVGVAGLTGAPAPVRAQSLVATVNDSPVTTFDLEQRMRLLRVLRMNASREAAIESLVEDRLKLAETAKYGIRIGEQDAAAELARIAQQNKINPAALGGALRGVDAKHWQEFARARAGWNSLVQALNKNVGVSETNVRSELAKTPAKAAAKEYTLRQVILVVPRSGAGSEGRMREAEGLRTRFTDCTNGVQLARALRDVAVRPPIRRSSASMSDELAQLIERTPTGRLTPPQRNAQGIEMLAVCAKADEGSDGAAAQEIRQNLLSKRMEAEAERMYRPIRKRAIIVRR